MLFSILTSSLTRDPKPDIALLLVDGPHELRERCRAVVGILAAIVVRPLHILSPEFHLTALIDSRTRARIEGAEPYIQISIKEHLLSIREVLKVVVATHDAFDAATWDLLTRGHQVAHEAFLHAALQPHDKEGHQNEDEQCTYHKDLHLLSRTIFEAL